MVSCGRGTYRMRLLFIQGGSRWKKDTLGTVYTDSNFNENIWNRYRQYCDELSVILRREEKIYSEEEAKQSFNVFDDKKSRYVALPDVYRPVKNVFSFSKRKEIDTVIKKEIKKADKVIIRSLGNIYTNTALKYARRYHKPYLIEVTGFAFEGAWYHSIYGKFVALPREIQYRHFMKKVSYAIYVTNEALQKRYPCSGKMLGCSDVELPEIDNEVLDRRLQKYEKHNGKYILGTAAFLDVKHKGQAFVLYALAELKKRGIDKFEYQLIGAGTGKNLKKIINELGLSESVKIIGCLAHEDIFGWLDNLDIYVQPSMIEGLSRAPIEAMSRACPIVCSDAGGNYELTEPACLFQKADYKQLADILEDFIKENKFEKEAKRSFEKAKKYSTKVLDEKRDAFYRDFLMQK